MAKDNIEPETRHATGGILAVMRRRRAVIALCTVLVPVLVFLFSVQQTKQYSATATLLFQNQNYAQGLFGTSANFTPNVSATDPTRQAATDLSLVQQSIIARKTAHALGQGLTQARVQGYTSVTANGQSDLVNVSATTPHPALSAQLANAYANAFIQYRRAAEQNAILAAERQVAQRLGAMGAQARNSPAGRELASRQQDLDIFAALQTGDAQLYQPASTPTKPSSPKPLRNAAIGIFVGLLLGVCLALIAERFDRKVRDAQEFEDIFQRPVLGTIQKSRTIAAQRQTPHETPGSMEMESFRLLRANLRYLNVDRAIRSVVVTSAVPGEGKSMLCWNLAAVSAMAGQRVLLIEADLRRPVFGQFVGNAPGRRGLSDLLAGQSSLHEVVQRVSVDLTRPLTDPDDSTPTLDLIASGPVPPNPADLLESKRTVSLLDEVIEQYDVVLVDTPPTSAVADALHLFPRVDGVIVVTRLGSTPRDRARQLASQLSRLGAPVLGIVVNGAPSTKRYGRYGDYGYGYQSTAPIAQNGAQPIGDATAQHPVGTRTHTEGS
jgi:receptor protein-tyrosine kinase